MKLGSNPYKGKASFSTRCYMKMKRIELWWRRWQDPEFRKKMISRAERSNPFHPSRRGK